QAVTLGGVTATTDDAGEVTFDLGARSSAGPLVLSPSTDLQSARYVLTVQLLRDGAAEGLRFAAPLLVGAAATSPGSTSPGSTSPGTTSPGTAPDGTVPGSTPSTGGGTPGTGTGGTTTYPSTGPYQLTSISPTRVSTAGGTQVTITGRAIPSG